MSQQHEVPLAIVGMSALFPGSTDATGFWRDILAGRDLIGEVPPTHWLVDDYYDADPSAPDKTYCKRGGFLGEIAFDPLRYGIPPSIASATDSSQLLGLIVAEQVLEDATRGQFAAIDRSRASVILGVTSGQELLASMVSRLQRPVWKKALREAGVAEGAIEPICDRIAGHYVPWQESTFPGLLGNVVAGRIANRFDLGGTNCVTDAACASAFAAVSMAANELYLGQSDLVITGGVDTLNDIFMYMCFSKTPALSPTGSAKGWRWSRSSGSPTPRPRAIASTPCSAASARRRTGAPRACTRRGPRGRPSRCGGRTRSPATGPTRWSSSKRTARRPRPGTWPSSPACASPSTSRGGRIAAGARSAA